MKKIIKASASGAKYAPIIGRDLDWFENDIERYVGKNAATLKKFLKDQDFVLDEMSGPARDSAWESWRLDTEAGNIMVVFYYDLIPTPNSGRLKDGKVTKAYVEDNQDAGAIRDEEARLFSSRKISGSKKRIVADEYYPENYSDLGYDGLDEAVKQFDELRSILSTILGELDEFAEEYDEWGGSTSTLEMFSGPDDAKAFAGTFYNLNKEAENILESVLAELR